MFAEIEMIQNGI